MNEIKKRLKKLKKWIDDGDWINPHDSGESNGYDRAVREEIEFLESIIELENKSLTNPEK
jgi:hypothetical protein